MISWGLLTTERYELIVHYLRSHCQRSRSRCWTSSLVLSTQYINMRWLLDSYQTWYSGCSLRADNTYQFSSGEGQTAYLDTENKCAFWLTKFLYKSRYSLFQRVEDSFLRSYRQRSTSSRWSWFDVCFISNLKN